MSEHALIVFPFGKLTRIGSTLVYEVNQQHIIYELLRPPMSTIQGALSDFTLKIVE